MQVVQTKVLLLPYLLDNVISQDGVAALLKAVRFQSTLSLMSGAGLMRLSVEVPPFLS